MPSAQSVPLAAVSVSRAWAARASSSDPLRAAASTSSDKLYLQHVGDASPLTTGLQLLPGAVLTTLVSRYLVPPVIERIGLRLSCGGGLLVVAARFALMLRLEVGSSYASVILPS